jgi:hypothetical protein
MNPLLWWGIACLTPITLYAVIRGTHWAWTHPKAMRKKLLGAGIPVMGLLTCAGVVLGGTGLIMSAEKSACQNKYESVGYPPGELTHVVEECMNGKGW